VRGRGPAEVSDFRSNAPEQIEYAVQKIGKSKVRLKLFEAVYHYTSAKSATTLAQRACLTRERVIKDIRPLVNGKIVAQERRNGDIYYSADPQLRAHKAEIVGYVNEPAKLKALATKRRPSVTVTVKNAVPFTTISVPSMSVDARQITVDDIEDFSRVKGVVGSATLPANLSETKFKEGIQRIVQEPGSFKDWGGEKSDLFTTRLQVAGARRSAAFAFKGPGQAGKLTIARMGKNGDQGPRLFQEPALVFLVQHWREIDSEVLSLLQSLAIARSATTGQTVWYGVIDGNDPDRIRVAYPEAFN
jgi:hypothetical protein